MTATSPSFALMQKAVRFHQKGQISEAEQSYREVLATEPGHADALRFLGGLYVQSNRIDDAIDCFEKALRLQPRHPELLNNLGVALYSRGQIDNALQHYQQAIEIAPDYFDAISNISNLFYASGQWGDAVQWLERATQLKPDNPDLSMRLGHAYHMRRQSDKAIAAYQHVLTLDPSHTDALFKLGNLLRETGKTGEACAVYQRLVELKPDDLNLKLNLGTLLHDNGQWPQAMEQFEAILKIQPDMMDAIINRGSLLLEMNRPEDAQKLYQQALDRNPQSPDALWGQALATLMLGQYQQGWALYESRFAYKSLRKAPPFTTASFAAARWDSGSLDGKKLLIWGEQGFGDMLQFIRYAALCKAKNAQVIVLCREPLVRLLQNCPFIDEVVTSIQESDFDCQVSVMSLPYAFQTTLETIPQNIPYLFVSDEARATWAPRFAGVEELKIGLVWAGSPRKDRIDAHVTDRQRSLSLLALQSILAQTPCRFYSLQKGEAAQEIAADGFDQIINNFMNDAGDFMDTAAIIENLDLVITVDTAVAHLAGALGKPVWILSRFGGCWRWLQNRETNPWYPTARIFGQSAPGDWTDCVDAINQVLADRLRS